MSELLPPDVERHGELVIVQTDHYLRTVHAWEIWKVRRDLRNSPEVPAQSRLAIYRELERIEAEYTAELEAMQDGSADDERRARQASEMILTAIVFAVLGMIASVAYLLWFE